MTSTALSPAAQRRSGWFADRPLAVKFGVLLRHPSPSRCGGVVGSMLIGNANVRATETELTNLNHAQSLVLQIDTRASELKVDGYKALVRPNAADELEELAGDIETPQGLPRRAARRPAHREAG